MDNKRFSRTAMMLGSSGIKKLSQAKVMIIGLGAVGGYVMEALARAGIGNSNRCYFSNCSIIC